MHGKGKGKGLNIYIQMNDVKERFKLFRIK